MAWHKNEVEEHFWCPISDELRAKGYKQSGTTIERKWFTRHFRKWEWILGEYVKVATMLGMSAKDVQTAVEAYMALAANQLKKKGYFEVASMVNLKLKLRSNLPAELAEESDQISKQKKTVVVTLTKKFKDSIQ